jgi:hypothetical protein
LLFLPLIVPQTTGATIGKTSGAFPPSVTLNVTTGTVAKASQPFAPIVVPGAVGVTNGTVGTTAVLYPSSALVGGTGIQTAALASTAVLRAPTLSAQTLGATIGIGSGTFVPSVAINITGGFASNVVALRPPSITVGGTPVTTGFIDVQSSALAPTVLREGVLGGGTVSSTTTLYEPSVKLAIQLVGGARVSSSAQVFGSTITTLTFVTGAARLSTASIAPPSVAVPAVAQITKGTIASSIRLYAPKVAPETQNPGIIEASCSSRQTVQGTASTRTTLRGSASTRTTYDVTASIGD